MLPVAISRWEEADRVVERTIELKRKRRWKEALAALREAHERFPESIRIHIEFSSVLTNLRDYAGALEIAQHGLALLADQKHTHWRACLLVNAGIAARRLGSLHHARTSLTDAVTLEPANPLAHLHLGRTLADSCAYTPAVQHLTHALACAEQLRDATGAPHPEEAWIITRACESLAQLDGMLHALAQPYPIACAAAALAAEQRARARAIIQDVLADTTDDLLRRAALALLVMLHAKGAMH